MTQYLFAPPAVPSLPIRGKTERFPINRIFCVGPNYQPHAVEMCKTVDKSAERPFYFTKSPQTLTPSPASAAPTASDATGGSSAGSTRPTGSTSCTA